jgi:DNA-binding MarR family transcriptional regulator
MTETRTPASTPVQFPIGPAVGMAEAVLSKLLAGVLAETSTARPTYLALQRMVSLGGQATRDQYIADLSEWLGLEQPQANELAGSLLAAGLLTATDGTIRLSETGAELRARVMDSVGKVTARLYEPFDPADLETTVRTLERITIRARELR